MKPSPILLTIPTPCHKDWDKMSPTEQGRFCSSCQKQVIDFTQWSDKALHEFFSKPQSSVCGRLLNSQLNRKVNIPYQPHSALYRLTLAAGLVLLFAQPIVAQQKGKAPLVKHQVYQNEDSNITITGKVSPISFIKGTVLDSNKNLMKDVQIALQLNGEIILETQTSKDGHYSIRCDVDNMYDVIFMAPGYAKEIIKRVPANIDRETLLNITLQSISKGNTTITLVYKEPLPSSMTTGMIIQRDPIRQEEIPKHGHKYNKQ